MLGSFLAQASVIPVPEAMGIAHDFFAKRTPRTKVQISGDDAFAVAYTAVDPNGAVDYYVINRADKKGYIIVAGDDSMVPVLGYTDEGLFDPADVPSNMAWWLGECQRQIEYAKLHPGEVRHAAVVSKAVAPLLTTMWSQSAPFNAQCPTYVRNYTAYRCATGCVATAMAQIMKYHEWPKQGKGEHSYDCNVNGSTKVTTLHADFSESVYDWDNMLDIYGTTYSTESKNAVAKLMSDVGISVDMGYGSSSGAFSPSVVDALTSYFDYDRSVRMCSREDYSVEAWEQMIRNELDNNRPVYYSGMSSTGGHAFVCDGYNHEGYFHFNWGWGGRDNGYFLLSMLNPNNPDVGTYGTGYNSLQEIIINIMPPKGNVTAQTPVTSASCTISPVSTSVALGEAATFNVTNACMTGSKDWTTLYWGVVATAADINATSYIDGFTSLADASTIKLGGGYSLNGFTYTPSRSLPEGLYYIRLAYSKDQGEKKFFKGTSPTNYVIEMRVKDGRAHFAPHYAPSYLSVTDMTTTPAYTGQMMQVTAQVTNNDTQDFHDNIYVALMKDDNTEHVSNPMLISLAPGESMHLSTLMDLSVNAGTYTLAILDNSKQKKAETMVTVISGGGSPSLKIDRAVTPRSSEMPANDIQATAVLSNTGGTYSGYIELMVLNSKSTILKTIKSQFVTIDKNGSVTLNFKGDFGGIIGDEYYLALRNPSVTNAYNALGALIPFTVCATPASPEDKLDVNGDGSVDIADINAVLVIIMGDGTETYNARADVNGDGEIDIADINAIVHYIMSD